MRVAVVKQSASVPVPGRFSFMSSTSKASRPAYAWKAAWRNSLLDLHTLPQLVVCTRHIMIVQVPSRGSHSHFLTSTSVLHLQPLYVSIGLPNRRFLTYLAALRLEKCRRRRRRRGPYKLYLACSRNNEHLPTKYYEGPLRSRLSTLDDALAGASSPKVRE